MSTPWHRYLVAYYDEHGIGHLVGRPYKFDVLTEAAARITEIEEPHHKPHKVDYRIILYFDGEPEAQVLKDNRIVG